MRYFTLLTLTILVYTSCVEPIHRSFTKVPPGIWRGILKLENRPMIPTDDNEFILKQDYSGELPFNMEVIYTSEEDFFIQINNGDEKIKVDQIVYGRDKATAKDTLLIEFPVFDTYLSAIYEDDIMEGYWHVNYRDHYRIPFKAYYGQSHRFTTLKKDPVTDLSGKWSVIFEPGSPDEYPAVGEFSQEGNHLTATFLTETGDYRFLEGTIQENKIFLSTFDGSHAFLFEAKVLEDGTLTGIFKSGTHYTAAWSANRNENATLEDPYILTKNKDENQKMNFTFENTQGQKLSLADDLFKDKIKLVKISGTWCPNCKDQSLFLKEYLEEYPNDDIEIIEVSFERYREKQKAFDALNRYKEKMEIPWPVLYGGYYDKKEASRQFPQLTDIISYPTLLVIDRDNYIRHIHTGFSGPATSKYQSFKISFQEMIQSLLSEKS